MSHRNNPLCAHCDGGSGDHGRKVECPACELPICPSCRALTGPTICGTHADGNENATEIFESESTVHRRHRLLARKRAHAPYISGDEYPLLPNNAKDSVIVKLVGGRKRGVEILDVVDEDGYEVECRIRLVDDGTKLSIDVSVGSDDNDFKVATDLFDKNRHDVLVQFRDMFSFAANKHSQSGKSTDSVNISDRKARKGAAVAKTTKKIGHNDRKWVNLSAEKVFGRPPTRAEYRALERFIADIENDRSKRPNQGLRKPVCDT